MGHAPTAQRVATRLAAALLLLIAASVGLGRLLLPSLDASDLGVASTIAGSRGQTAIDLASGVSQMGSTVTVLVVTAVAVAALLRVKQQLAALFIAISSLGSFALYLSVKYLVQRPRPPVSVRTTELTTFSFPSGHATTAAALYLALGLVLAHLVRSRGQAIVCLGSATVLAAVIAASRVYLGLHYVTDVAVGLVVGATWTLACRRLLIVDDPEGG